MRSRLFLLITVVILLFTIPAAAQTDASSPYRIVGYYTSWAIYDRQFFVTDIAADKLTHINYAFANISEEGEILLGDEWADIQFPYPGEEGSTGLLGNFHQLQLLKEAHPGLQTLISVGGWTWSDRFSDVALTAESRAKFAASCVQFIIDYGFDGVDMDWEYPTGGGEEGNIERPEDPENFVLLLNELRTQLDAQGQVDGRPYLLTIAVGSGQDAYQPLDWTRITPLLDFINVMTYDMSGSWSELTGFNAPLYESSAQLIEGLSTDSALQDFLALGVPADKVVMGVPFYGTGWQGVGAENNGLYQPHTGAMEAIGGMNYVNLVANYIDTYQRFWDDTTQVPWLYDSALGTMISYDDPESLTLKAAYIREHNLSGIMFWELSGDTDDAVLLTTIYDVLNGE